MAATFDLSLYLVTDRRLCGSRGVLETVRQAVDAGVTMVQLRDPRASRQERVDRARELLDVLRPRKIPLIMNDDVEAAAEAAVDGVHLGQDDVSPLEARRHLGRGAILGLSIGTQTEFELSRQYLEAVDYVGMGPVNPTGTKADAGQALGIEGFRAMRALIALPVVAIGGLTASDAAGVIKAGADGIAVISAICASHDVGEATRGISNAIKSAR